MIMIKIQEQNFFKKDYFYFVLDHFLQIQKKKNHKNVIFNTSHLLGVIKNKTFSRKITSCLFLNHFLLLKKLESLAKISKNNFFFLGFRVNELNLKWKFL